MSLDQPVPIFIFDPPPEAGPDSFPPAALPSGTVVMSFTVDKAGRAHALQVESFQPDSVAVARIWARKVLHGVKLSRFRLRIGPHGPMATEGFSYVYRFHYQPKD